MLSDDYLTVETYGDGGWSVILLTKEYKEAVECYRTCVLNNKTVRMMEHNLFQIHYEEKDKKELNVYIPD